ncbi:hypothetical protein OAB24_04025 [Gammaproteobacteria bacterium]|nr:hypothetical protein [Gammaproteobacteria bacterium]
MRSRRQQQKKRKDFLGIIGIIAIFALGGGGYYLLDSNSDALDPDTFCSIDNGPTAVTAIVFDKSQAYSVEQVTDIKTSFDSWLAGKEPSTKNRPIDLSFFAEGTLVQLYVTDNQDIKSIGGLDPKKELCVPKDFRDSKGWISNPQLSSNQYKEFVNAFSSILDGLLREEEGISPIMETFVRLSNSASFLAHTDKQHNIFIISDMLQHSDNYSHYASNQGMDWKNFEQQMAGTVYLKPRLNNVGWQVFLARRNNPRDKALQKNANVIFWENFFRNAKALPPGQWISIDG